MLFISIHYHYRADGSHIEQSKRMRNTLIRLYDASTSLYSPFQDPFRSEDSTIRDSVSSGKGLKLFSKFSEAGSKLVNGVDTVLNNNEKTHWFKSESSYAIVDNALSYQKSAAALAKRIWLSFVPEGSNVMRVEDIIEVLGSDRRVEAEQDFEVIDRNENGDITLSEFVLTVLETSKTRHAVYQGMTDINRAINTLDWICCFFITMAITIYGGKHLLNRWTSDDETVIADFISCPIHPRPQRDERCRRLRSIWVNMGLRPICLRIPQRHHLPLLQTRLRRRRPRRGL